MTNFRRALLALITFIAGVGLSLGVGAGIASAHHPVLEKTTARPCGAEAAWTGTVTVHSDADYNKNWRNKYAVDAVPSDPYSELVDDQIAFGPIAVGPFAATVASVTFYVTSNWQYNNTTDYQVTTSGSIVLSRPDSTTCPLVPVTPAVTYTPPTCFAAGTVVATPGEGFTWSNDGLDPVTFTATANPGYSLTNSGVFGPYAIASIIGTEQCKPYYDPEVVVVETPCTAGATDVTITTTTTTYHAEFINGVWVKVADEPTIVVSHRPLNESEVITCVPTHEPKVVTVDDGQPECGDTTVNTTTTTTYYTYTYEYDQDVPVWVEHTTEVVTHGSREVSTEPCPTPVTGNVTFTDPTCANDGETTFTTQTVTGVEYTFTGDAIPGGTVTVTAAAVNDTYTYVGTSSWTHTYPDTPDCRIVSEPVAPAVHRSDLCDTKDTFTAGPTTGVVYSVASGSLNQGQIVVVIATPAAGYKFAGEIQIVSYTVVGGAIQNCPMPTTVSIPSNVPLPRTGGGTSGLTIGGILFGAGTLLSVAAFRRRKVRNA